MLTADSMRVCHLSRNTRLYSSNVYLVLGDWSRLADVNTLVDAGADPQVISFVEEAPTGVGKRKVDRVILTHRHYDHSLMLPEIRARFGARVAGWGPADDLVDEPLTDGQLLRLGDDEFEVVHTPAHTDDSICLYSAANRVLFAGDTPLLIQAADQGYHDAFIDALARLADRPVSTIYFGHGNPLTEDCNARLYESLANVRGARTKGGDSR
jgi:glyoxylase-like metal-dependent hydrolase (beta-lactamase superfamily II)